MSAKFFEIIPHGTRINFVGKASYVFAFSTFVFIGSLALLFTKGLNYGVDFTGGSQIHLRFHDKVKAAELREVLKPIGLSSAMVQGFGEKGSGEFLIRVQPQDLSIEEHREKLQRSLDKVASKKNPSTKIRFSEERIYVTFGSSVDPKKIEKSINSLSISDLEVEMVSRFGPVSAHEYLVQFRGVASRIINTFRSHYGAGKIEILQVEQVGAKVGAELRQQAVGAILISIVLILIYIWFRFDLEYAPGAIAALLHDALFVLGVFSFFQIQFDLSIVAAVLTIVGLSINDTIVVYDRFRENIKKSRDLDFKEVINTSINETLSRTILTSGTGLIAALSLLFLGGPITFNFALAFTIGIVVGTYSSIYVASPLTIYCRSYLQRRRSVR